MQSQFENTYLETVQQTPGLLDTYLEGHSDDPELIAESLAIDLMEDVARLSQEKGISRSDLANLMNVSRGYVTRLLNSPPNLTLMSVARLSVALNAKPYVGLMVREPIDLEIKFANAGTTYVVSGKMMPHRAAAGFTDAGDTATIIDETLSVDATRPQFELVATGYALASIATSEEVLISA